MLRRFGLMKMALIGFGLIGTAGCIDPYAATTKARAANDLKCPEEQILVANIGGTSYRATGCTQEATYNCVQADQAGHVTCQREEQKRAQ
jgi:hypothetical protein